MGGAWGMVPSKVPIVEPSTCWVLAGKACKASKDPTLHNMMFPLSKLLPTVEYILVRPPLYGDRSGTSGTEKQWNIVFHPYRTDPHTAVIENATVYPWFTLFCP
jgi:hypothetical protein